ncbi:MAG: T9SS type A sorting domain-containing protein [Ignavibacteria bacterium]|nr:T9SS type A sorting domain-containing protein [Ignavibacteria bacterium]
MKIISGVNYIREYNLVWYVEATDGLYTTYSNQNDPLPSRRNGHHLFLKIEPGETGIEELPKFFELGQCHPNPFHSSTVIRYTLPRPAHVTLAVFDLLGTRVKTLVSDMTDSGAHTISWDGSDEAGRRLPSGTYVVRMTAGEFVQTRVLMLMK